MPNNDNTDQVIEHPWLDFDDWEIVFRPYEGNPDAALMLGVNLTILQSHIAEPELAREAIGEVDAALEALFMRTQFPDVSYTLFRRLLQGSLTVEEQELLESLGIKL
jgi:hypothetical protein